MIELFHWRKEGPNDPRVGNGMCSTRPNYSNMSSKTPGTGNWYDALAETWKQVLDKKESGLKPVTRQTSPG
jgi:hypothetical protein